MTPATALFLVAFGLVAFAYAVVSVVFFYHIGRYSYLGDASKRVFLFYLIFGTATVAATFVFMILNHLIS